MLVGSRGKNIAKGTLTHAPLIQGHYTEETKSIILIGQELHQHGHRVRVAAHSIFQSLVHRAGLEFFSISNDPEHPIAVNPHLSPYHLWIKQKTHE